MNRFFLLFVTVVVVLSLFVIPAAAADEYVGNIQAGYAFFDNIPTGSYELLVYVDDSEEDILLHVPYVELRDGSYSYDYDGLNSIFSNVSLDVIYSEGVLQCALYGISEHNNATFQIFGSVSYPNVVAKLKPVPRQLTFLESIGSFFSSSMDMMADVATVITSYPALLILTIGVIILGYIAFQIKRLM